MPTSWTRKSSEERKRLAAELVYNLLPRDGSEIQWSALKKEVRKKNVSTATLSTHLKEYTMRGSVKRRVDASLYPPRVYYSRIPMPETALGVGESTYLAEATDFHFQEKLDKIHSLGIDLDKYVLAVTREKLIHIMAIAAICLYGYLGRLASFRDQLLDPRFLKEEKKLLQGQGVHPEVIAEFLTSQGIDLEKMAKSIRNEWGIVVSDKVDSFLSSHGVDRARIDAFMRREELDDEKKIQLATNYYKESIFVDTYVNSIRQEIIELVDFHHLIDPRNGKPLLYDSRVGQNFLTTLKHGSADIAREDFLFLEDLEKRLGWSHSAQPGGRHYPWEEKQTKKKRKGS